MRRILLVLTVALVMAVMMVATAGPVFADAGGQFKGKGDAIGGGHFLNPNNGNNNATGGGQLLNNPHLEGCGTGC